MSIGKVYSYLRFSSPQQEWGDSERRQESLAKEYCAKHGLKLSDKSFADRGISGAKGANRRGALGTLLNILKPGDSLLIEDNDRLSREDPLTAMNLLHSIVFMGVTVITARDSGIITKDNFFNLSTFLPSIVKSALANEENVKKSGRIKESWNTRRKAMAKGEFIGGKIPFWLNKGADGQLSIIENRAKVVKDIFDKAYKGMGFRAIMHELAKANVSTYRRKKNWSKGGISYLLRNIAVYGAIQPHTLEHEKRIRVGDPVEGYYPAIITKGKFLAVQEKINRRKMFGGGGTSDYVSNLFTGICKCKRCGENAILSNKGRQDNSYLVCSSYHWHHKCTKSVINYIQVEKSVLDYISKEASAIQHFSHDDSAAQVQQSIDEKMALLKDTEQRIVKLTDAIEGPDDNGPIKIRLNERLAQKERLRLEVDALVGQQHADSNKVSISSVVADWTKRLTVAGLNVNISPQLQAKIVKEQQNLFSDRFMVREALRNSVSLMEINIEDKTLFITWNSKATSEIEMKCQRMGRAKAVYLYRAKTNTNAISNWINIGTIMATHTGMKQLEAAIDHLPTLLNKPTADKKPKK